jgi:hypothetical protein
MAESIYQKIRQAVAKTVDAGAHFNAASAAEGIGKSLGLSDALIQFAHVELRNAVYEPEFKKIPFNERALFLPHCSRNSKTCIALNDDEGLHCQHCGGCDVSKAVKIAEKLGYTQIFMVPGGSMVKKMLDKYKPRAAVGVSCFHEAIMAFELTKHVNVVPQVVMLVKDGCKDTVINFPLLEEKLSLTDKSLIKK